jgi:hypothetical protein
MKNLLETIAPYLLDAFATVFGAILLLASARASTWIKAHAKNAQVEGILLRLNDATYTAVGAVEQTVVAAAKGSQVNGQLTEAAATAAKQAALAEIKSHLGPKGIAELKTILGVQPGDLASFLSSRVESAVQTMPESKTVVPPSAAVPSTPSSEETTGKFGPPRGVVLSPIVVPEDPNTT